MLSVVSTPDQAEPVALRPVDEPVPAPNEALVAVAAFSLNRGELALLERRPAGWRPGQDIAGTVVQPAADGSGPPYGARVVGLTEGAGWSERAAVRTSRMAVLADGTRFEDAAVLPIPGLTALRALRRGGFLLDKSVMITGATGIVGSLAIELAQAAGAQVTAVARADAAPKLRQLGAADVVATPTDARGPFHLILESVGGETLKGAMARVAPAGVIVVYGNTSREPAPFSFMDFANAQNARIETLFHYTAEPSEQAFGADLALLAALLGAGKLTPPISGEHDWAQLPQVIKALRAGRFRGKPVFRVTGAR